MIVLASVMVELPNIIGLIWQYLKNNKLEALNIKTLSGRRYHVVFGKNGIKYYFISEFACQTHVKF